MTLTVASWPWGLNVQRLAVTVILPSAKMEQADAEAIAAVLAGSVNRYAELVDRYQGLVFRLAVSLLGNSEDAKDASQEAFVSAYSCLGRFRGQAKFSTWLYRIVVNECYDAMRRRRHQPAVMTTLPQWSDDSEEPIFLDLNDEKADPSQQMSNKELAQGLSNAIGKLPMKQRTVFVLHHLHGMTLAEVAEVAHCRLGTVKAHLFRATASLRLELAPWLNEEAH